MMTSIFNYREPTSPRSKNERRSILPVPINMKDFSSSLNIQRKGTPYFPTFPESGSSNEQVLHAIDETDERDDFNEVISSCSDKEGDRLHDSLRTSEEERDEPEPLHDESDSRRDDDDEDENEEGDNDFDTFPCDKSIFRPSIYSHRTAAPQVDHYHPSDTDDESIPSMFTLKRANPIYDSESSDSEYECANYPTKKRSKSSWIVRKNRSTLEASLSQTHLSEDRDSETDVVNRRDEQQQHFYHSCPHISP